MPVEFEHKIDKNSIPTCDIMGVHIAAIDMNWLLDFTDRHIRELAGDYICAANVHTTVTAYEDPSYCVVQNGGAMAIPDGGPLSTVAHMRGCKSMSRTTGPTYMEKVLERSAEKGYRHFFYGSTEETLQKMSKVMQERYPDVQIAGMYSPPFRPLQEQEDEDVIRRINDTNPDFIWVGLGAPKQEIWMADHQGKVNGLMVGVGAAFDYLAGNLKRAPKWMQDNSLEWIFRLIQDPKRLFTRYWNTNMKFIRHALIKGE